jgi:predicted RND superfamily exporter protein
MDKLLLFFLLLAEPVHTMAQSYGSEDNLAFVWEVKQIDEFIERFNGSNKTLLVQYYKKNDPSMVFTREKLIKSLFNTEDRHWDLNEIVDFIAQVNNKQHPKYLDFFRANWYATVRSDVTYKGAPRVIIFLMILQRQPSGSSKWIISGATAGFLRLQEIKQHLMKIPEPRDSTVTLNPASNTNDFLNIDKVSKDKANIKNYFLQAKNYNDDLRLVENEILNGHLVINKTINVSYDFKQIPGWEIAITQYNRQTRNSGWLINRLTRIPVKN